MVDNNPPIDTPLRDIATEVGEAYPGSTVLVLSPTESGTFSTTYDRTTLEAGQDVAEGRGPVQGSKNFVSELTTQHFPWTTFTIVVVLGVMAAVVATRVLQLQAKRAMSRDWATRKQGTEKPPDRRFTLDLCGARAGSAIRKVTAR